MTDWLNWESRLAAIAREHADMAGPVGEQFRLRLARAKSESDRWALGMAHGQVRTCLVNALRHAFRAAALMAEMPATDLVGALRSGSIAPAAAERYAWLAQSLPEMTRNSRPRRGMVTVDEALLVLGMLAVEAPILAAFFPEGI